MPYINIFSESERGKHLHGYVSDIIPMKGDTIVLAGEMYWEVTGRHIVPDSPNVICLTVKYLFDNYKPLNNAFNKQHAGA